MRWRILGCLALTVACGEAAPSPWQYYSSGGDAAGQGDSVPPGDAAGADTAACDPECPLDERRCQLGNVEECRRINGCETWVLAQTCSPPETCVAAECVSQPCVDGTAMTCEELGICRNGTRECISGVWGPCDWELGPSAEACDGLDNDCNGVADDLAITPQCPVQLGVCAGTRQRCSDASLTLVCDDRAYAEHAAALSYEAGGETLCDGEDNDCDGETDEASATDPQNCGSCGRVCPPVERGTVSCVDSDCHVECDADARLCLGACPICPIDHVAAVGCQGAGCVATACDLGFELCGGACCIKGLATARITEVFIDDDGQDAVELLVLTAGELDGLVLSVKNGDRYAFPDTVARAAGDVIVYHAQDPGTDETGNDPLASTDFESTSGFDFWDPAGAAGVAITATDAELELLRPDGESLDYVAWCDGGFGSGQASRVAAHVAAGHWSQAGAPLAVTDLVDSTLDNGTNQSLRRTSGTGADTDAATDWSDGAITLGTVP